jgi:hypothetical protein
MNYTNGLTKWYAYPVPFDPAAIAADAVALAELHGGTGNERPDEVLVLIPTAAPD